MREKAKRGGAGEQFGKKIAWAEAVIYMEDVVAETRAPEDVEEGEGERNVMPQKKEEEEELLQQEVVKNETMVERGDGIASSGMDDIDKPVLDFIRSLERHCRACEDEGKYAEAEAAYTRWDELWVHEETRRR